MPPKISGQKVPVSARALLARINRHLGSSNLVLKKSRGEAASSELGAYFLLDMNLGTVSETQVSLSAFARRLGLLSDWEELDDPAATARGE